MHLHATRSRGARVYSVDYQDARRTGPSTCHIVAGSPREARAIAASMHPAARILEARIDPTWTSTLG